MAKRTEFQHKILIRGTFYKNPLMAIEPMLKYDSGTVIGEIHTNGNVLIAEIESERLTILRWKSFGFTVFSLI